MEVAPGGSVVIKGASGSGKTTLLSILGLLETPTSGDYWLGGSAVREMGDRQRAALRNKTFGFVFQQFSLIPDLNAWQNVARPLGYARVPRNEQRARAMALLEQMGLADRAHHRPAELSGGEQQRVAIARALVNDPEIILADEPIAQLPESQWAPILEAFDRINGLGKTLIVATHQPELARLASRRLELRAGALYEADDIPPSPARIGSGSHLTSEPAVPPILSLEFLGRARFVRDGKAVTLPARLSEILAILAQHPEGLSGEQLLLLAYGEAGRPGALKTALTRLRAHVTIASQPYQIDERYEADFLALRELLAIGDLRGALTLYRGPLLPASTNSAIAELRDHLTESLRRAVLGSHDSGLVYELAQKLEDDLELWEEAAAVFEPDDPRRALAIASLERTRRRWQRGD